MQTRAYMYGKAHVRSSFLFFYTALFRGGWGQQITITRIHWPWILWRSNLRYYPRMPFLTTTSSVDTTGSSVTTGRSGIWTPDLGLAVKCIWPLDHPAAKRMYCTVSILKSSSCLVRGVGWCIQVRTEREKLQPRLLLHFLSCIPVKERIYFPLYHMILF